MNTFRKLVTNDIERLNILIRARNSILKFWETHIYKYFNARLSLGLTNTGQLGKSLRVEVNKGASTLNFFMIPLHNDRTAYRVFSFAQMRMPSAGNFKFQLPSFSTGFGRQRNTDYGELMRKGFASSNNGQYDVRYDRKTQPGSHPGYDKNTRWVPWKKAFDNEARKIIVRAFTNELANRGINIRRIRI
jgi:hypothetical protein